MVFDNLFRKDPAKTAQSSAVDVSRKKGAKEDFSALDFGASFEKEMEAPDRLLAEEILGDKPQPPSAPKSPQTQQPEPRTQQQQQKIPAFVSLDKYKEIMLSLRDMKMASSEMRRTLENLRQNRDSGISLLNTTVSGLERMEGNIDKIRGVLRT